jgi:hypothetical protein
LSVDWGHIVQEEGRRLSVIETWKLVWEPEFLPQIIQAGAYGSTIVEALNNLLKERIAHVAQIDQAVVMLAGALQANMTDIIEPLTRQVQQLALDEHMLDVLLHTSDWLIQLEKYGSYFLNIPTGLDLLRQELLMRILIRIPTQVNGINDDEAQATAQLLQQFVGILALLNDPATSSNWHDVVALTVSLETAHPLLQGLMHRILFDAEKSDQSAILVAFNRHIAVGTPPKHVALWLQGFLMSGARILQYHAPLRRLMTQWLNALDLETLQALLPLLRMATSTFAPGDKARLLTEVRADETEIPQNFDTTTLVNSDNGDAFDFFRLLYTETETVQDL